MKEDPRVSAFSLTLKAEEEVRPPPITRMGCGGHGGKSWHIPARRDSTGVGVMLAPCRAAPGLCWAKDKGCRVHSLIYCCGGSGSPCVVWFPLPFLPASDREGFCDAFADGLTPTSSEDPDFGERKSLMKAETSMGKPFPVLHEYHKHKSPKGPGQAQ